METGRATAGARVARVEATGATRGVAKVRVVTAVRVECGGRMREVLVEYAVLNGALDWRA